ncbi:MAG: DMT family transporter [Proteobacteria bacterium]|nr:DMT family transporter [Pseudomonadota bacterium]
MSAPSTLRGMLLMVASTVFVVFLHAAVRHVSAHLPPAETAFFRTFFALLLLGPWFLKVGLAPFRTRRIGLHLWRSLMNVAAMITLHEALAIPGTKLSAINAISFTSPLFASVAAVFVLGEAMRARRALALVVGFAGMLVIFRPGIEAVDVGGLWALGSAVGWALVLILTKILARTEASVTIVAYMALFLTAMNFVPAFLVWVPPTPADLGWLAMVGACQVAGQMCIAQSLKEAEATAVMPLDFGRLVWATLVGYLLFAEVPDPWTWIGGTVIFASATYITVREARADGGRARPADAGEARRRS